MALSREKILDTAFSVLNQYGLADLSMRRLATELNVAPGSLYYHIRNKQELLASLASRMLSNIRCVGDSVDTALSHSAQELYTHIISIPEGAEVIRLALALHPEDLPFLCHLADLFTQLREDISGMIAAKSLVHLCLSLIEEEQTTAVLEARKAMLTPPSSYQTSIQALIRGWLATE
ncbi:TetR/AcrR family transcriptional regulator [Rothia sp. CCM 9418]|uniref:TetR/AcrR family transcriptional regulator n=1 Tax=unclassified Rothia (in: high G+C Gram-positive bacteria) TaxID=2689056 RepID=UPI003ACD5B7D